jgi:phage host-nuclease inhibitor protein Gam
MDVNTLIGAASTETERDLFAYDEAGAALDPNWRIESLQSADWSMRRIAECEAEAAAIDTQFEAAVARLVARRDALKSKAERGATYFRNRVAEYAERERATLLHGRRKSRDLLHGRIGWRSKAERLEVVDKDALVAWLSAQPVESGLYRVKVEPELRALQERFKATGEIPPGCDVKPAEETIAVEAIAPERALKE